MPQIIFFWCWPVERYSEEEGFYQCLFSVWGYKLQDREHFLRCWLQGCKWSVSGLQMICLSIMSKLYHVQEGGKVWYKDLIRRRDSRVRTNAMHAWKFHPHTLENFTHIYALGNVHVKLVNVKLCNFLFPTNCSFIFPSFYMPLPLPNKLQDHTVIKYVSLKTSRLKSLPAIHNFTDLETADIHNYTYTTVFPPKTSLIQQAKQELYSKGESSFWKVFILFLLILTYEQIWFRMKQKVTLWEVMCGWRSGGARCHAMRGFKSRNQFRCFLIAFSCPRLSVLALVWF